MPPTALTAPAPGPGRAPSWLGRLPVKATLEGLGRGLFALVIFFTCFTFLRPSPYDLIALPTMALWFALGIRVHRAALAAIALLVAYHLSLLVALLPYLDESVPVEWTNQSLYLMVTGLFFVMFFSDRSAERVELGLKAYLASCLFAAICGILSFADVLGEGLLFRMDGRAAGVFEDPNLLGSFLILSALYLIRDLLTGEARRVGASLLALLVLVACIFLSFSRGSWGAMVVGTALMVWMTWRTSPSAPVRRRVARLSGLALLGGAVLVGGLLSLEDVRERFSDRAVVTKDYDEGETGRFGNQRRGIPMLLEHPEGFGPLRWRLTFNLDPHNSYIGAFANGGWAGGLSFLGLVLATSYVGFRLCFRPSPYQRLAQIVWPALLMFFLQALQIDIEKWRHVYMMLGMVWGLEAARRAWARGAPVDEQGRAPGVNGGPLA